MVHGAYAVIGVHGAPIMWFGLSTVGLNESEAAAYGCGGYGL